MNPKRGFFDMGALTNIIPQSIIEHAKSMFFCNLPLSVTWFAIHQSPCLCNKEQVQMEKNYGLIFFLHILILCFE